ncbi:MAG: hypothetical protein K0S44_304 [Bacteroidetes bacterium]|jgi:hypothetical protein|nr:hypothetical protein [Bacteroidota bacterium]
MLTGFAKAEHKNKKTMSTKTGYLPRTDADRAIWMNNFANKIATYAPSVGITPAEVTSVNNDKAYFQFIVNMHDVYKQTLNNITAYKNLLRKAVAQQHLGALPTAPVLGTAPAAVPEGIFDRVSKLAQRIKASVNYTEAMGQDLGIIAPEVNIDLTSLQPELRVKLDAGRPFIKATKGIADAIDLFVNRNDGNNFISLGRLLKPEFIDTTNLPSTTPLAEWEYKAMYVIGNDNVGVMSPTVSVVVKRQ